MPDKMHEALLLLVLLLVLCLAGTARAQRINTPLTGDQAHALYVMTVGAAGIGVPDEAPFFYPVTQSVLDHLVCSRAGCGAQAAQFGEAIFYLHTLDVRTPAALGVLVHEVVHYLQWRRDGIASSCEESRARELQAYRVQAMVLEHVNVQMARPELPRCS